MGEWENGGKGEGETKGLRGSENLKIKGKRNNAKQNREPSTEQRAPMLLK
jgi:hypothetical protein